ncbi:YpdA family putative bacillithiol disulfide reductase [Alteribacillus sp. HJP-4]|uniref:YpdA family putative bacillithiol disulfide reductase n=1 Tax=Alteribacillus sp. HJP-4 TaxID=2775394 RepID=UPI0035CD0EFF
MVQQESVIIIGAGPCGLSAAIELQKAGVEPLVIEKDNIVHSIYNYPLHQTFFSSSDKLEIGGFPFPSNGRKPVRQEALVYYRKVALKRNIRIASFEEVTALCRNSGCFFVDTRKKTGESHHYSANQVVIATGYFNNPNYMNIEGEDLSHVNHYFRDGHPYFKKNVVIIGGKNSAVDAALALEQAEANVTLLYRGESFTDTVKPWILPDLNALIRDNKVMVHFRAEVSKITNTEVHYIQDQMVKAVPADAVFSMTGYHPDQTLLKSSGASVNVQTGKPVFNEDTMETDVKGLFIAGVIAAGIDANEIFIENGRFHGEKIAEEIRKQTQN